MIIRRALSQDIAELAEFNINMAQETEAMELIPEVITLGVKGMIENPQRGYYLVVELDNGIQASLMVTTEWSDWRNGMFWWIQSVYVRPAYRRQGLYRELYARVKELAEQEPSVCGFRLYVERDNTNAQKTYESLGMVETEYKLFEELQQGLEYKK
jgi:ribosomal protein S18 acetylase RimI-like enzyme